MPRRILTITCLILAGEAIFSLPFHVARFFRKPLLEVFGLSNADLGDVFAVYGITAMLAYFPGGTIADRFSARRLMAVSLVATALGGVYMTTVPGTAGMAVLFAYWGVTTILLFWAAMIRGTREWGGANTQGLAFGILDGGRGLLAAGLASIAVMIFAQALGTIDPDADPAARRAALITVIWFYSAVTLATALLVWLFVPDSGAATAQRRATADKVRYVLRQPVVWAQAAIVVCAYCGYKGLDNYALYAVEVLGMSEVEGARFTAQCAYLRPVAALAAGLLADRVSARRLILTLFVLLGVSFAILGTRAPAGGETVLFANILVTFAGVYAFRGVYFALLEECAVPSRVTGTAVGLISLVGFTPDIFFAAIGGRLLDAHPGLVGHQHYFLFLAAIMLAGAVATLALIALHRRASARAAST